MIVDNSYQPSDDIFKCALVDSDGRETPITTLMVEQACTMLAVDAMVPPIKEQTPN